MANNKSAEKRIRVAERRRDRNKPYRTAARTTVRRANEAIADGDSANSEAAVLAAIRMLDRVAGKGVIHPNNAARRKSRLMAKLNQLRAGASLTA